MTVKKKYLTQSFFNKTISSQNEAQLQEFLEIASESIIIIDCTKRNIFMCNTNATALLKCNKNELQTKNPVDFSPDYQPDGKRSASLIQEYINRVIQGEKLLFEWLTIDGNGRKFMTEVRLAPILIMGKPMIYASFRDITQRIETNLKLESQNKKLKEIAYLQSHQVRRPAANIQGLIGLFDFKNQNNPINLTLLEKLEKCLHEFDDVVKQITLKTCEINQNSQRYQKPL